MRDGVPVRPLIAALFAALAACAHVEAPPGGPEDRAAPAVLTTRPDDDAVVPGWSDPVVISFDERLSEQGVQDAVLVSPRTSPVEVRHAGNEIRVSLRGGWRPGTVYQVTVLPEVRDLFTNALPAPVTVTFSTGPAIPETRVAGRVVQRVTGEPEALARVEAIRLADSLVYATRSDSAGRFALEKIPEGDYRLRAFPDQNRNRALDAFEARDSAALAVASGAPESVELALLAPDSTAPAIAGVTAADSTLAVRFDDFLDPAQEVAPEQVEVVGPGGSVSVARAAVGTLPAADSAAAAAPAGLPSQTLEVELAADAGLDPEATYVVRVRGIRNVNGVAGDAEAEFEAPPAARVPPTPGPG